MNSPPQEFGKGTIEEQMVVDTGFWPANPDDLK